MWLLRLTFTVWLAGAFVESGPVRKKRSIDTSPRKVVNNMKDFNTNLQARFELANHEMDRVAKSLKDNLDKVIYLTSEVDQNQQKTITDTMATLLDLTKRMNYYRSILYNLAEGTIRKTNSLIKHLKKYKDSGQTGGKYKVVLTVMKQLLSRSETTLTDAEVEIEKISMEMSKTEANILVFQATIKAAKLAYEEGKRNSNSTAQILTPISGIVKDIADDMTDGKWNTGVKSAWADFGSSILTALPKFINLGSVIDQVVNTPDLTKEFDSITNQLSGVLDKIEKESKNIEKERELVKAWKTEVVNIRKDYFDDDELEPEWLEPDLIDDTVLDFEKLKEKAQAYMDHIDNEYPEIPQ
jgi:hypothetical protein